MFTLIVRNNFYGSVEQVLQPELRVPSVDSLSHNDGAALAHTLSSSVSVPVPGRILAVDGAQRSSAGARPKTTRTHV